MTDRDEAITHVAKDAHAQGRDAFAAWWNAAGREKRLHVIDNARHLLEIIGRGDD